MSERQAILLLGPTGAGKTPLGEHFAAQGFRGRPCRHFDFGAQLRRLGALAEAPGFSAADLDFIRQVLEAGALLEDAQFRLAETILRQFLAAGDELVVLNGLPRHQGQAEAVARIVRVTEVVALTATPNVVVARLAHDSGGDRGGRLDDDLALVRRKLATYNERTAPLIEHYCAAGVPVRTVAVTVGMSATEMARAVLA